MLSEVFTIVLFAFFAQISCSPVLNVKTISRLHTEPFMANIFRNAKYAAIYNYMNETVDPCDDFYEFACGKWPLVNPVQNGKAPQSSMFEELIKDFDTRVEWILKSNSKYTTANISFPEIDKKVRDFYESCINLENLYSIYKAKLLEIVEEFGIMPVLEDNEFNENEFDWIQTIAKIMQKYRHNIIFKIEVMSDIRDNIVNRIWIGEPEKLPFGSRSMYLDDAYKEDRENYAATIQDNLMNVFDVDEFLAKKTATEIVNFEISLANGMINPKLNLPVDQLSLATTVDEMQTKYEPTIDTKAMLYIMFDEVITGPIIEYHEEYQQNVKQLIEITPKYQVANYIFYTMVSEYLTIHDCIDVTKEIFIKYLNYMVYQQLDAKLIEEDIHLIWSELSKAFHDELSFSKQLNWIHDDTRHYALEKLNAMKFEVTTYDAYNFTEDYGELDINRDDYLENIKSVLQLKAKNNIAELHKPVKSPDTSLEVSPLYILSTNVIQMPAMWLQPYYLWQDAYPKAMKFGSMGATIGHELIHGFDDQGRNYDINGNAKEWWNLRSLNRFNTRRECFIKQYGEYSFHGHKLPESTLQTENIADNGGLRLAYTAYMQWYNRAMFSGFDMATESVPRLKYSNTQLFFISFAQFWCTDVQQKYIEVMVNDDEHAPGKIRVIGSISNFEEFADAFNCSVGSNMNPKSKCKIF